MKTITINTLKKELITKLKKEILVIETPEETYFEVFKHGILFKDHLESEREFIEGSYTLLGSPDEIKEEDVRDLVGEGFNISANKKIFNDYNDDCNCFKTALESFRSALESEIYWENPYGKEPIENLQSSTFGGEKTIIHRNQMNILWNEAESRTFDRNRTLIFIKN